jgi:anti-sigma regulatory factor (Ser/Thr protein kinase)
VYKSQSFPVTEASQVGEARRASRRLGLEAGLDETALGNLGIIATELGTNLHKHAKQGEIVIRRVRQGQREGVEILSVDRGPGIDEVARCMRDGFSTTGTQGNGLGAIRRLSAVFDMYSTQQGTVIVSQSWNGPVDSESSELEIGAICLPAPGETLCGDAWTSSGAGPLQSIMVADGLGHGVQAAEAADQAIEVFKENAVLAPTLALPKIHAALRSTRGAAVLILHFVGQTRKLICSGVGNISCALIQGESSKSFVSLNGTIGHQAHRFQEFLYDWTASSLVVFHSDGLQTKWKLPAYPGLQVRHPSLIAAVLYRDFRRGRDDVTVLVARESTHARIA